MNPDPVIMSLKSSEELFGSVKNTPDSDDTLVEDSDDSLVTIVPSPPLNPVIINESDSNDSSSLREQDFNLSHYNFPHDTLPTVTEELVQENEVSFSQHLEAKQKVLSDKSMPTPSLDLDPNESVTLTPKFLPPSRERIISTMELYGIPKCNNIMPFFSNQEDANGLPQNPVNNPLHKARGRGLASIPQFRSCLEGVTGLEEWRKMKVKEVGLFGDNISSINLRKELAGNDQVTIEPVKQPPSVKSVVAWVKARKKQEEEENKVIPDSQPSQSMKSVSEKSASQKSEGSDISVVIHGIDNVTDASKLLGVSCGQIEFTNRASVGNVAHENLGNSKAFTRVSFYGTINQLCNFNNNNFDFFCYSINF